MALSLLIIDVLREVALHRGVLFLIGVGGCSKLSLLALSCRCWSHSSLHLLVSHHNIVDAIEGGRLDRLLGFMFLNC